MKRPFTYRDGSFKGKTNLDKDIFSFTDVKWKYNMLKIYI